LEQQQKQGLKLLKQRPFFAAAFLRKFTLDKEGIEKIV